MFSVQVRVMLGGVFSEQVPVHSDIITACELARAACSRGASKSSAIFENCSNLRDIISDDLRPRCMIQSCLWLSVCRYISRDIGPTVATKCQRN